MFAARALHCLYGTLEQPQCARRAGVREVTRKISHPSEGDRRLVVGIVQQFGERKAMAGGYLLEVGARRRPLRNSTKPAPHHIVAIPAHETHLSSAHL